MNNLTSKTVSVGNRKINATWTREMADDLINMYKSFRYKLENESEKLVIEKYFKIKFTKEEYVHYNILNKQEIRKLKLLILKQDELAEILKKILDSSELVNDPSIQDIESSLIEELSKEINKNISNKLMNMNTFQYGK
jgi:hypothetical protein